MSHSIVSTAGSRVFPWKMAKSPNAASFRSTHFRPTFRPARADVRLSDTITVYVQALNLFDADVETARTAPAPLGVVSLDQPRTLGIGLRSGL